MKGDMYSLATNVYLLKTLFVSLCTYYTFIKLSNYSNNSYIRKIMTFLGIFIVSAITTIINEQTNNSLISTMNLLMLLSFVFCLTTYNSIGISIIITAVSLTLNYLMFFVSAIITFLISKISNTNNDLTILLCISAVDIVFLKLLLKTKRLKYGISFFKKDSNEYFDVLILNISVITLFSIILLANYKILLSRSLFFGIVIFAIIMFITIQKSLQLYYKQKLLVQELEQTKQDLANKTKEIEDLEAENIRISKKSHTLVHKQKSLEHKIEEMMMKTEISKEEAGEVKDRLNEIRKDLYKEKEATELSKTGIPQIDDMLKFMQSECIKNKIDFELQLKGNIHHMTNKLIAKEDLETLLADHIKNAIIAINHTENVNRSILVKLGKIDETYGLYIYDSGIEFEKETLENLGKKPSTTHKDEGGTGMGFMNTFDTLRKCNASLIIEEYNKPSKDNYTKALMIKFDNKNEFKVESYRKNENLKS